MELRLYSGENSTQPFQVSKTSAFLNVHLKADMSTCAIILLTLLMDALKLSIMV